jgi:hypothetical protein
VLRLGRQAVQIETEYQDEGVWAGLVGQACERARRERGRDSFVVPIAQLPHGLKAWLGLQEVWEINSRDIRQYIFRHLGLTVHFGLVSDPLKPQVFRCEWPGIRDWTGSGPGFQSSGAGHPHWQFDLSAALRAGQKEISESEFDRSGGEMVEDFAVEASPNVMTLLQSATIERMHFASAAPWWQRQPPDRDPLHMNAPQDQESLSRWLLACIAYMKQELERCEIHIR